MNGDFFGARLASDQPRGLGAAMAGGRSSAAKAPRQPLDFYPTPPAVTRALIAAEGDAIRNGHGVRVWEPCGRGGAIARELSATGFETVASDLVPDPANRVAALNLLDCRRRWADVAITNPPFALASQMIAQLLDTLATPYVALLLKSSFWHAEERTGLFRRHRPTIRYDLTWRPDFLGQGAPTMECSWFVWDRARPAAEASWALLGRTGRVRGADDLFDGETS